VEEFLQNDVQPVLDRYAAALTGSTAELKV
jgi:hypothetical protein